MQGSAAASILLVEDEVLVRFDTAEQLRATGMVVREAADAEEALAVLESGTKIDLVFTDVRLAGQMDGIALAKTIDARYPGIKVILCSGDDLSGREVKVGHHFFQKPYRISELHERIEELLKSR